MVKYIQYNLCSWYLNYCTCAPAYVYPAIPHPLMQPSIVALVLTKKFRDLKSGRSTTSVKHPIYCEELTPEMHKNSCIIKTYNMPNCKTLWSRILYKSILGML